MKLLLVTSLLFSIVLSADQCFDSNECEDSTLEDNFIQCDGYWACTSSSITTTKELDCDGDNGCTFASIVADDGAVVEAYGYLGAFRAHIINEEGQVLCQGAYGCYLADIIGYYVSACGYYSAYQSAFTADSSTMSTFSYYNYGYQSAAYGDVVVTSDNTLNLYYYGYYSGYRNYIDCQSGSTCNLYCLGLGCQNTELFCYSGATCTYDCSSADACPVYYSIDSTLSKSKTISAAESTGAKIGENIRRLKHANDEELKQVRQERHEFREKQRPIDEAKWAEKDPKFKEFMKKRPEKQQRKRISSHNQKLSNAKSFISKTDKHVVKDLTGTHILYGIGVSSIIYFTLTLLWYFMYYKPRKNDLYTLV